MLRDPQARHGDTEAVVPVSKHRITLRGKAARSLVASLLISSKGTKATEGTTGPMKVEIEKQIKETKP